MLLPAHCFSYWFSLLYSLFSSLSPKKPTWYWSDKACHNKCNLLSKSFSFTPAHCFPLKKKTSAWYLHSNFILLYNWESTVINSIVCASQNKKLVIFLVTASYNHLISSSNSRLLNYTINKNFPSFNICSKTVLWVHESRKKRNVHLSHEFNQCKPQILINYLGYQNLLLSLLY